MPAPVPGCRSHRTTQRCHPSPYRGDGGGAACGASHDGESTSGFSSLVARLGPGGLDGCFRGDRRLERSVAAARRRIAASAATAATVVTTATCRAARGRSLLARQLLGGEVALVDPDLHADAAEGGAGLVEAVVDVRAQRVQRHTTLAVELGAAHLGAVQPAGDHDPDALGTGPLGRLHALAHGAPEIDTGRQLLGDALSDELRIGLGVLDLEDVQLHLLAGQLLQRTAQAVGLGATAADDDARTGGVDVHTHAVTGALDLDLADAGAL